MSPTSCQTAPPRTGADDCRLRVETLQLLVDGIAPFQSLADGQSCGRAIREPENRGRAETSRRTSEAVVPTRCPFCAHGVPTIAAQVMQHDRRARPAHPACGSHHASRASPTLTYLCPSGRNSARSSRRQLKYAHSASSVSVRTTAPGFSIRESVIRPMPVASATSISVIRRASWNSFSAICSLSLNLITRVVIHE